MWTVVKTLCYPMAWTLHWGSGYSDNSAFFLTRSEAQEEADRRTTLEEHDKAVYDGFVIYPIAFNATIRKEHQNTVFHCLRDAVEKFVG
jgi:hypothetical protein